MTGAAFIGAAGASGRDRLERLERLEVEPGRARSTPAATEPATTRIATTRIATTRIATTRIATTRIATTRIATVGRISVVIGATLPAFATSVTERADVSAVSSAAALAIVIGALRWAPSTEGDDARPVAGAALSLLGAVALELFVLAWGHPGWTPALLGPMATIAIVAAYLSAFGFRSAFLLRRLGLLSLLLWTPVAHAAERVVRSSIDPLSDLIYRRLASIDVIGVGDHPWRVFTAMTDRATVLAITAVVIGTAMSRRRLTARGSIELAAVVTAAMVVHHGVLLASPIERYERTWWVEFISGPGVELALGAIAAAATAAIARRSAARDGRAQNPSVTAAPDRDPVLFAVLAADDAALPLRVCTMSVPLVLLAALAIRTVA